MCLSGGVVSFSADAPEKQPMADTPAQPQSTNSSVARFGPFELDPVAGELRRRGKLVNLQDQQVVVLKCLVERAGDTVTREELRELIWPEGTFVEFEFGLYNAVNRLRRALGDTASNPHFIETVPKQGYRFIAAVHREPPPDEEYQPLLRVQPPADSPAADPIHEKGHPWLAFACVAILFLLLGFGLRPAFWRLPAAGSTGNQVYRYSIISETTGQISSLAISPAGDQIVFQGSGPMLYRLYLEQSDPQSIRGTESGRSPFFSPDGQSLGFFTEHELKILEDGRLRTLAVLPPGYRFHDAQWAPDGYVYYNSQNEDKDGIWRIPEKGGKSELVVGETHSGRGDQRSFVNQVVTRPRHLLVYSANRGPIRRSLHVLDLDTHIDKTVVERGIGGYILPSGHLVYYRLGSLFAVSFDARSMSTIGTPLEMVKDVADYFWQSGRAGISANGTLVYVPQFDPELRKLSWLDSEGRSTPLPLPADQYEQAEVSPKGDALAIVRGEGGYNSSLWTYHLATAAWRHISSSQVPYLRAQWSPDETELVVSSERQNQDFVNLNRVSLADPRKVERLTEDPDFGQFPLCWSAKANAILFVDGTHPKTNGDLMVLPLGPRQTPKRLVATPGMDRAASFSPDGRYFVYETDDSGQPGIFVRSYEKETAAPGATAIRISQGGGHDPVWSPDGSRIYYTDSEHRLIEVRLSAGKLPASRRIVASGLINSVNYWTRAYSMAPDGRLLVMNSLPAAAAPAQIQVVVNWMAELKRLVPVR